MNVIKCDLTHIKKLCEIAEEFIQESNWPLTYSENNSALEFYNHITAENSDVLAVEKTGELLGGAIVNHANHFCNETTGYIFKLFYRKNYRRSKALLVLMDAVMDWMKDKNCAVVFATSAGGIDGAICGFTKLMQRYDFEACGFAYGWRIK